MAATLLAGPPGANWKAFIKARIGDRDLIILDPSDSEHGFPGRALLIREGKVVEWLFLGCSDPVRNPIGILAALHRLLSDARPDPWVLLFGVRLTPVLHQTAIACAQASAPEVIWTPAGSHLTNWGWPVGAEEVELEKAPPEIVTLVQRRSQWVELWDGGEDHEIFFNRVHLGGTRLGSGKPLETARGEIWAEAMGDAVFALTEQPLAEGEANRLLDAGKASRLVTAKPQDYLGLVCSFADQDGRDFALGVIREFDLKRRKLKIRSKAVAPAPVRILKIGSLRIDRGGQESEDLKPWSI